MFLHILSTIMQNTDPMSFKDDKTPCVTEGRENRLYTN